MAVPNDEIGGRYEEFYLNKRPLRVYPTEFVVRIFLSKYPELYFERPSSRSKILDLGFGDGRNAAFLCESGFDVSGIEITQGIVDRVADRLSKSGYSHDLRVGYNHSIPFEDESFNYILACHSCYYCDRDKSFLDNIKECFRVLASGGFFVASIPNKNSYVFSGAEEYPDGSFIIRNDPYHLRNGERLHAFDSAEDIQKYLCPFFKNFSFGSSDCDYFGIFERVFWVVCQKE